MINQQRVCSALSAYAYVLFTFFAAASAFLPLCLLLAPGVWLAAALLQKARPNIVFLRRFGSYNTDPYLTTQVLPIISRYARIIWLEDRSLDHVVTNLKRPSTDAFWFFLSTVLLIFIKILLFTPLGSILSIVVVAYITTGAYQLLKVGIGSKPYVPTFFYMGSLIAAISPLGSQLALILEMEQKFLVFPLGLIVSLLLLTSLRYTFIPRQNVSSRSRLVFMQRNPWGYSRTGLSVQSIGPALVDRVEISGVYWPIVVRQFLDLSKYAAVDITYLKNDTGLRREIEWANQSGLRILYLCDRSRAKEAKQELSTIVPDPDFTFIEYAGDGSLYSTLDIQIALFFKS